MLIRKLNYQMAFNLLFVILIFFVPFGQLQRVVFFGTSAAFILIPILCIFFLLSRRQLFIYPYSYLFLLFSVWMLPAIFARENGSFLVWVTFLGYMVFANIGYNLIENYSQVKLFINTYLLAMLILSILSILAFYFGFDIGAIFGHPFVQDVYGAHRLLGSELNPNTFGYFYIFAIPLITMIFCREKVIIKKVAMGITFFLYSVCLINTVSRAAMLGVVAALGVFFFLQLRIKSLFIVILSVIGMLLLTVLSAYFLPFLFAKFSNLFHIQSAAEFFTIKQNSFREHLEEIRVALHSVLLHPFFGVSAKKYSSMLVAKGYHPTEPNNAYLGISVLYGLPALAFFLLLMFFNIYDLIFFIKKPADEESQYFAMVLLSIIIGVLVYCFGHTGYENFIFWMFVVFASVFKKIRLCAIKHPN